MNSLHQLPARLSLLYQTLHFLKKHVVIIFGLGLIAAFGRVMQLGGFGQITPQLHIILEVIVESARIFLFLYVLGLASISKGLLHVKHFVTNRAARRHYWKTSIRTLKARWPELLLNFLVFLGIAWVINYAIDLVAYQTCLYLKLKQGAIIDPTSSEWTIILFFKNISVIPLTLTFYALFLHWILNRFRPAEGMLPESR